MRWILISLVLIPNAAFANFTKPDPAEVAIVVLAEALIAVDVWQTLDLKHHPDQYELNPVLGRHPSDKRLLFMGAAAALVTGGLWYTLPPNVRWIVPCLVLGIEVTAIGRNASAGMALRF